MECVSIFSGECSCRKRCRLDQLSSVRGAPTRQTQLNNSTNARTVIYQVTSPVTRSCWKSPNRGELTHFCSCLHRRRSLLKKWSRRHREGVSERKGEVERGDSRSHNQRLCEDVHGDKSRSESFPPLHLNNTSPLNPLNDIRQVNKARQGIQDYRTPHNVSGLTETLRGDMCLAVDMSSKLSRSRRVINEVDVDCSGAASTTQRVPRSMDGALDDSDDDVQLQSRLRLPLHSCPDITPGRLVTDLANCVTRATAAHTIQRLRGGHSARRVDARHDSQHESRTLNPTTQPTFHRWVYLLLICIMVLPIESSSASGLPYQGSVVEEPGHEPGYKQSFYQNLPPKAVYESVIICLLAVSAFIGLIVWVLKSNFEERQQKRMRREASLRERTSSVAFLKT